MEGRLAPVRVSRGHLVDAAGHQQVLDDDLRGPFREMREQVFATHRDSHDDEIGNDSKGAFRLRATTRNLRRRAVSHIPRQVEHGLPRSGDVPPRPADSTGCPRKRQPTSVQVARMRSRRCGGTVLFMGVATLAAWGLAGLGCRQGNAPSPGDGVRGPAARNVVVVTIDTLRADHVGAYRPSAVPHAVFRRGRASGACASIARLPPHPLH